jgi:hypothetical protein
MSNEKLDGSDCPDCESARRFRWKKCPNCGKVFYYKRRGDKVKFFDTGFFLELCSIVIIAIVVIVILIFLAASSM